MALTYKAKAVVLHTVKYGDSSLVAYLFTDVGGRTTYMVQGVRSKSGKGNKGALFQPMFILDLECIELPRASMHRIKEVRNEVVLTSVPFDIRKSTISLFMAEVLYRLIHEVEANKPLFDFISSSIQYLDHMSEGISNFHLWFLVNLSSYLGFYPGNEYVDGHYFDIKSGLFVSHPSDLYMSLSNSRLLGQLMDLDASDLSTVELSRGDRGEFMESMLLFFGYHFDSIHSVRSIQILREVF